MNILSLAVDISGN